MNRRAFEQCLCFSSSSVWWFQVGFNKNACKRKAGFQLSGCCWLMRLISSGGCMLFACYANIKVVCGLWKSRNPKWRNGPRFRVFTSVRRGRVIALQRCVQISGWYGAPRVFVLFTRRFAFWLCLCGVEWLNSGPDALPTLPSTRHEQNSMNWLYAQVGILQFALRPSSCAFHFFFDQIRRMLHISISHCFDIFSSTPLPFRACSCISVVYFCMVFSDCRLPPHSLTKSGVADLFNRHCEPYTFQMHKGTSFALFILPWLVSIGQV